MPLSKILFPNLKITKAQIIEYYGKIAPYMLPHIKNRPLTLKQFPHGISDAGFYHKHVANYYPPHIQRLTIPTLSSGESITMPAANTAEDLEFFAGQNTIEFHMSLSTIKDIQAPDQIILDLDPSDNDFEKVRKIAFIIKDIIDKHKLKSFVKTTGSRGVHIHIPLLPKEPFKQVKAHAKELAELAHSQAADLSTMEHLKTKRGNKVYIDYLRNDYNMTAIAPYSLRANEDAGVATPITWHELKDRKLHPRSYNINNILNRVQNIADPWRDFF